MANCEISLNLAKLDLQIINRWIKRHPQTYGEFIRENFPDNADEIIQVAERVISQKRTEITPSDLDMSFDTGATQVVEKQIIDLLYPIDLKLTIMVTPEHIIIW